MAYQGKRRGVRYYFRIELNSLQGKVTSGLCFLGVFATFLMGIASAILKPALDKSQYIANVVNASDHQLLLLSANTDRIVSLSESRILRSESLSKEDLGKSTQMLLLPLDSLKTLSAEWESTEAGMSLKVVELKAGTLLKNLKALSSADSQEEKETLLQNEIFPLQHNIKDQIEVIQGLQLSEKKEAQAYIDYRTENLISVLVSALIFSIFVGACIGAMIVLGVLKEVRMLRSKILELSEGKLIEPIPNTKNELNSIIKVVNTLTENLRNIQFFAKEVGKGNFDTHVSVFGGENDLGESLAGMRDSLKTVALEEKRRNWVTSGHAHFSELLRRSTDDMDAYYQSIISELVRYLNINQAALYVLKTSEREEDVLEMKASYAYGRLKYQHKVISPGQGMAGQVYLEKEPLFLKNMPVNYLQISSGLGEATPNHLAVVPLKINNVVNGVLELASFQALAPHEVDFLLKIAENISGALHNVHNVQTTSLLLQEAQSMAQAMQSQEEMLRQNSEELIATQEQLSRDLQETNQQLALLEQTIQYGSIPQLLLTQNGSVQLANKQADRLFGGQITGKNISTLLDHQELIGFLQKAAANTSSIFSYQDPAKGSLEFHLYTFAIEQQLYVNLQIVPQISVSIA